MQNLTEQQQQRTFASFYFENPAKCSLIINKLLHLNRNALGKGLFQTGKFYPATDSEVKMESGPSCSKHD